MASFLKDSNQLNYSNMSLQTATRFFLQITLFMIMLCPSHSFSQKSFQNLKSGVKETESNYSGQFIQPNKITFTFFGDPEYANYYFSDLKEHIFKTFSKKGISVVFSNRATDDNTFILKVDNSRIVHENDGYDREMRYELEGILNKNAHSAPVFSFKVVVNAIHDINQQNQKVAEYLLTKISK